MFNGVIAVRQLANTTDNIFFPPVSGMVKFPFRIAFIRSMQLEQSGCAFVDYRGSRVKTEHRTKEKFGGRIKRFYTVVKCIKIPTEFNIFFNKFAYATRVKSWWIKDKNANLRLKIGEQEIFHKRWQIFVFFR